VGADVPIGRQASFSVGTTMVGMGNSGLTTLALALGFPAFP
jgi:hypothetical protein